MTIPFEEIKARLLANPRSRRNTTPLLQSLSFQPNCFALASAPASRRQSWQRAWEQAVRHCAPGERTTLPAQDPAALRRSDRIEG